MFDRALLGNHVRHVPEYRPIHLVAAMVLLAFVFSLGGCSVGGSASGEGTIDISSAKGEMGTNSSIAKAASARGKAGMADVQKARRK
jgi:hypothetical protein